MLRFGLVWLGLYCVLVWGSGVKSDDNEVDIGPGVNLKWRLREAKALAWYNKYYLNNFNCEQNCTFDSSSWGPARYACTSDGALVPNSLCSSGQTYIDCKSSAFKANPEGEYSIVAPGSCICPSDCSSRGSCGFAGCTCDPGYTGEDCKLVECGDQKCNGRGTCASMSDLEIDTCVCNDGYATNDCSAEMEELPPIPNLLSVNQYTSWDDYGDNSPIFNESTIAQIYITINPEDLSDLTLPSNQDQRIYKHANFSFYNGAVSKRIEDVGFRVKGGSSRNFAKKSWKISFTHFNDDQKWAQQKKISLKSASMDPLYLRERAALASITSMGGPAQRSSHTTLYINGQYWGLYIILEEAGSNQFLQSRFGNEDGSLWKITDLNTLNWVGDDQEAYRNNTQYVAANDQAEADYTPLIKLVDILNNSPDDQFEAQISSIMNVEFFLRTLSAEVATGNWDGGFDGNNYYLYYNTDSLFYYYRYDLDISFGSTEEWFHGANRNVWTWGEHWVGRRLIMRILRVPSFQSVYASYLMKAITYTNWDPKGDYTKRLEIIHQEIAPPAKDDQWHTIDQYGYSYSEFENNFYHPVTRPNVFPPQGVFDKKDLTVFLSVSEFLIERVATIEKQVAGGPSR